MSHIAGLLWVLGFLLVQRTEPFIPIAFNEVSAHVLCGLLVHSGILDDILGIDQLLFEQVYVLIFSGQDLIFDLELLDNVLLKPLIIILQQTDYVKILLLSPVILRLNEHQFVRLHLF